MRQSRRLFSIPTSSLLLSYFVYSYSIYSAARFPQVGPSRLLRSIITLNLPLRPRSGNNSSIMHESVPAPMVETYSLILQPSIRIRPPLMSMPVKRHMLHRFPNRDDSVALGRRPLTARASDGKITLQITGLYLSYG